MNLRNIQLVCRRELQDQLRDRRTLFMVVVLPLLMYPLMGSSFFQLAQFMRGHTSRVLVVGAEQLDGNQSLPPLIEEGRFAASLFDRATEPARQRAAEKIKVSLEPGDTPSSDARRRLTEGKLDAIVVLPVKFSEQMTALRAKLEAMNAEGQRPLPGEIAIPNPVILSNSLREESEHTELRVERLLDRWQRQIVKKNLAVSGAPQTLAKPFRVERQDVAAGRGGRTLKLWSTLLPFVVFVWALTGAFYPAIDLCAGEKERGTLETLLASPASRNEIVWGKLLTVTLFSIVTAVLNLFGMAVTSQFITGQLGALSGVSGLTAPPLLSLVWLLVALPPLAALFSALSLACASFARSTKEGQYYFMPLFLALLPLMMIPMAPGVELTLGNALVPVMGLVLVLQALLEQRIAEAVPYLLPVTLVTFGCCLLAIKWAVAQFNQESVLFRESERFDVRLWLRRMVTNRVDTPTAAMGVLGVGTIFGLQFFANSLLSQYATTPSIGSFTQNILISQACVLVPALVTALWLTRRPRASLLLDRMPRWWALPAAGGLALAMHPVGMTILNGVQTLYPLAPEAREALQEFTKPLSEASLGVVLLLTALLPAICEEITFRGFLLGALRKSLGTTGAVVLSAVAFGMVHTVLQQSLGAVFLGLLLGYLAVATRSLWPGIIFHGFYNSLSTLVPYYAEGLAGGPGWVQWLLPQIEEAKLVYPWPTVAVGLAVSAAILWRIGTRSPEAPADPSTQPASPGEPLLAGESAE